MIDYAGLDILFLAKEIPDYLHDAVFLGLTELGCNVVDEPRKPSLHGDIGENTSVQLRMDIEPMELRKRPDLMIIAARGHENPPGGPVAWMEYVKEKVSKYLPQKVVILDGQDKPDCLYPVLDREYDAIFKREMERVPYENWHGINFSAIPEPFEFNQYSSRQYDVSYMVGISIPYRLEMAEFVRSTCWEFGLTSYVHASNTWLPRKEYNRIIGESKTCISIRGMGWDCYRYWEIPAKGCVMISEKVPIVIENDFTNEHCFKFETKEDLRRLLMQVKNTGDDALQEMALKALLHTYQHHTPRQRAKQLIDKVFYGRVA